MACVGAALVVHAACGDDADVSPPAGDDAGADASAAGDASDAHAADTSPPGDAGGDRATAVDRGPTVLPFAGDPEGIYWDYGANAALYVADDANNRIAKWTDGAGFSAGVPLPAPPPAGATLGQVVRMLDGTMLVTRLGYGDAGSVVRIDKTGDAGVVAGLDPAKQRMGLAIFADGTLADTYFVVDDAGARAGSVAKLTLVPLAEKPLLTGFDTPVAVIHHEGRVYVTEATADALVRSANDAGVFDREAGAGDGGGDGGRARTFATIDRPEDIAEGPDGLLYVTTKGGAVVSVDRSGAVATIASGMKELRGVAFDGANRRLFVAEHDPAGTAHAIHILPIP